jgi:hypothetical protein
MNCLACGFFPAGVSSEPLLFPFALLAATSPVLAAMVAMDFNKLRLCIGDSSGLSIQ